MTRELLKAHNDFKSIASIVLNALRRDAQEGRPARGEMADDFTKAWNELVETYGQEYDKGYDKGAL